MEFLPGLAFADPVCVLDGRAGKAGEFLPGLAFADPVRVLDGRAGKAGTASMVGVA
jgi:hypothetical protein